MKRIKLMADYGCYPLWGTSPDEFGDISPDELPLSAELKKHLFEWAARYDAILDPEDPISSGFKNMKEEEKFITDGYILAQKLRNELGSEYEIVYTP